MLAGTTTGAIYGNGSYFARDAVYSKDYACSLPSGQRKMLVAEVVVGMWTKGRQGMREMPLLPGERFRRYHALVNDEQSPSIFVVQHSSQAYPAYLLAFH
jgi:poly [ADP-ribose] polymerase 7/11/12/13